MVYGLVNGQWKPFSSVAEAMAAGAVDVKAQPGGAQKMGPPHPRMYWDEMTGQWRFPQPDGSTPGAMPSIGLPTGPGSEIAPFPPSGPPEGFKPWIPPGTQQLPVEEWTPPQKYPDKPIYDYPPNAAIRPAPPVAEPVGPEWSPNNPFEDYVRKYPDLMEAYKKHKSKGGKGDASSWGKLHYERHGQKEKRKIPGLTGPVDVPKPRPDTAPKTPDWGRYLSSNPDLMKAFGTDVAKAKQHWAQFGSKEKRKFTPY